MIPITLLNVILIFIANAPRPVISGSDLADARRTVPQIIESRGFKCESHTVVTVDGYILTLHRVVNPLYRKSNLKPIILHHGLMMSSAEYVAVESGGSVYLPPNAPVGGNQAFELSRRGYDVWLPNSRGNRYSRRHVRLNPDRDKKYWEFSFDEKSRYDLPAVIDYILAKTHRRQVGFAAVSQGALIMFMLMASEPKYNAIIKPFIAIAPVVYMNHIKSPFTYMARTTPLVEYLRQRGGELFGHMISPLRTLSSSCVQTQPWCKKILDKLIGYDGNQFNTARLQVYTSHFPAGTSVMNILHYMQFCNRRNIERYDFGQHENVRRYGRRSPPEYKLGAVTNRYIVIMSAPHDQLADSNDLQLLRNKLSVPIYENYVVPNRQFDHYDFVWGRNAPRYVVAKVIRILERLR